MTVSSFGRSLDQLRPLYRLYRWAWSGLDWLFPPHCGGCGRVGGRWCRNCQDRVSLLIPPLCARCGRSLVKPGQCPVCRASHPPYQALRSWTNYQDSLRNAIRRLKYAGDMTLGEILARPLIQMLKELKWELELVVPVPLGATRQAERGYNQAALLAFPLALSFKLPYSLKAVIKVREVRSQVGLSLAERYANVAGAFQVEPRQVSVKSILVVDDVTTSGATMQACAAALREAGSNKAYGITLARADHPELWATQ